MITNDFSSYCLISYLIYLRIVKDFTMETFSKLQFYKFFNFVSPLEHHCFLHEDINIIFSRFEGSTSYVIFNGSEYCLYSLLVLYYNRLRLYSSDTSCLDTSYLLPRTGNGTTSKSSRRVF